MLFYVLLYPFDSPERPFEIYFFLEIECLSKFIFSLMRAFKIVFSFDFLSPPLMSIIDRLLIDRKRISNLNIHFSLWPLFQWLRPPWAYWQTCKVSRWTQTQVLRNRGCGSNPGLGSKRVKFLSMKCSFHRFKFSWDPEGDLETGKMALYSPNQVKSGTVDAYGRPKWVQKGPKRLKMAPKWAKSRHQTGQVGQLACHLR